MQMSKRAGVLLKPHIPLLVYSLLEALGSLEPQYLNYLSLHAASNEDVQNKVFYTCIMWSQDTQLILHVTFVHSMFSRSTCIGQLKDDLMIVHSVYCACVRYHTLLRLTCMSYKPLRNSTPVGDVQETFRGCKL